MSENGEIYTVGKNFTLLLAVTAVTNSTSLLVVAPLDRVFVTCSKKHPWVATIMCLSQKLSLFTIVCAG